MKDRIDNLPSYANAVKAPRPQVNRPPMCLERPTLVLQLRNAEQDEIPTHDEERIADDRNIQTQPAQPPAQGQPLRLRDATNFHRSPEGINRARGGGRGHGRGRGINRGRGRDHLRGSGQQRYDQSRHDGHLQIFKKSLERSISGQ